MLNERRALDARGPDPNDWRPRIRVATFIAAAFASIALASPIAQARSGTHGCLSARVAVSFYVSSTHRWQARHDAPRTPVAGVSSTAGCAYVRWAARTWQHRSRQAHRDYLAWFTATYAKWSCIHSHEGSWQDEGLPQMGGLQMDPGFQHTYGAAFVAAYGDAGHWPVWAQLLAAERAFHGYGGYAARGYAPWPNTARACGLL